MCALIYDHVMCVWCNLSRVSSRGGFSTCVIDSKPYSFAIKELVVAFVSLLFSIGAASSLTYSSMYIVQASIVGALWF